MKRLLAIGLAWLVFQGVACADDREALADGLYVRGLYEPAAREYLDLLRGPPEGVAEDEICFRLGECYRQLDQPTMAERFYKRVIHEFPESPFRAKAELRRAQLFLANGQDKGAVTLLQRLLAADPPADVRAAALYELAQCRLQKGHKDEALALFRTLVDELQESPWMPLAALAQADLLAGDAQQVNERRRLYGLARDAATQPRVQAEALFQMGELAFAMEAYDEAAAAYGQLMQLAPDDPRAREAALQAAWSQYHAGHLQEALAAVRQNRPEAPLHDHADEWAYLEAISARQLGQTNEALAAYARILEEQPNSRLAPEVRYEQAWLLFSGTRFAELAALADEKAEVRPPDDYAFMIAEALRAEGLSEQARTWYAKLLRINPDYPQADRAMLMQARLAADAGQADEARAHYQALLTKAPDSPLVSEALFEAAALAFAQGDREEASRHWKRLADQFPDVGNADEALFHAGIAEKDLGRAPEALALFGRVERYANSAFRGAAFYWTGVLNEEAERWALAIDAYRAAEPLLDEAGRASAQYRRAAVLHRMGETQEAASLLQGLLGQDAMDFSPALLEWLARYQVEAGHGAEAVAAAQAMISSSSNEQAFVQVAAYLEGEGWALQGQTNEALGAYARAAETPPVTEEGAEASLRYAEATLEMDPLKAAQLFERVGAWAAEAERSAMSARAYLGLGYAAAHRGETEEAIRHYLAVSVLFDDPIRSPEAMALAIELLRAEGRHDEAARLEAERVARYPESPQALQAEAPE